MRRFVSDEEELQFLEDTEAEDCVVSAPLPFSFSKSSVVVSCVVFSILCAFVRTLVLESYPQAIQDFYAENGISLVQIGIEGNKVCCSRLPLCCMRSIIARRTHNLPRFHLRAGAVQRHRGGGCSEVVRCYFR